MNKPHWRCYKCDSGRYKVHKDKSVVINTKYEIVDTLVWDGQVYLKIQESHKGISGYRWTRYNYMENKAEEVKKLRGYT